MTTLVSTFLTCNLHACLDRLLRGRGHLLEILVPYGRWWHCAAYWHNVALVARLSSFLPLRLNLCKGHQTGLGMQV